MQNPTVVLIFSLLDQKYSSWANSVQKIRIVTLSWDCFECAEFNGAFHFFLFRSAGFIPKNPFSILMLPDQFPSSVYSQRLETSGCSYSNPLTTNVPHHIGLYILYILISYLYIMYLICIANQLRSVPLSKATGSWNFTKTNTPPWVFWRFLNCTYGIKLRKASHTRLSKDQNVIWISYSIYVQCLGVTLLLT